MDKGKTCSSGGRQGNVKVLQKSAPEGQQPPSARYERQTPPPAFPELTPPRIKAGEDGRGVELEAEMNMQTAFALSRAFGTEELDVINHFMDQLNGCLPQVSCPATRLNRTVPIMHGLKPQDEMEAMLNLQLIGVHNCLMECLNRALHPNQTAELAQAYVNRVTALAKAFVRLLEALEKYRGKGSQQRVTVEHVHINQGAQAIVGTVTHQSPRGE